MTVAHGVGRPPRAGAAAPPPPSSMPHRAAPSSSSTGSGGPLVGRQDRPAKPSMASPSSVRSTRCVSRANNCRPAASSSRRTCWLTVDWRTPSLRRLREAERLGDGEEGPQLGGVVAWVSMCRSHAIGKRDDSQSGVRDSRWRRTGAGWTPKRIADRRSAPAHVPPHPAPADPAAGRRLPPGAGRQRGPRGAAARPQHRHRPGGRGIHRRRRPVALPLRPRLLHGRGARRAQALAPPPHCPGLHLRRLPPPGAGERRAGAES
ncbi:hypothetical protein SBADM41S_08439 [Streptomyces badius]